MTHAAAGKGGAATGGGSFFYPPEPTDTERKNMHVNDEEKWQAYKKLNSEDFYSKGVVDYVERWANLMEDRISNGSALRDIAAKTSHEADTNGITGFMYGCAVGALAEFWIHGEELRKWHNGEYGHEGEGVVNPAVITIGTK